MREHKVVTRGQVFVTSQDSHAGRASNEMLTQHLVSVVRMCIQLATKTFIGKLLATGWVWVTVR